ncbi:MAG: TA system antitoxin ParD family protein [Actinomycetes bacterium]|jgi:hypothetical protein
MGKNVKLSEDLVKQVSKDAKAQNRSVPKQIEFYYRVARASIQNPDLPIKNIIGILNGIDDKGELVEHKFR